MLRILNLSFLFFVAFVVFGFSQKTEIPKLFPFDFGNKCGYINQQGEIVVAPQFDLCRQFDEGMAGVSISKKSGYINEKGQIVIPLKFEGFFPESFSEGLAPIKLRNESGGLDLGYVDKSGNLTLLQDVTEIDFFYEGLAAAKENNKWGYINKSMQFVIPAQFDLARSFADGRAWVVNSGKSYYINTSGRKVIKNYGTAGSDFSEGFAVFRDRYLGYGYINTTGKVVIKPQPNYPCLFNQEMACAKADGKWGYIDRNGKFLIPPQFDEAEDFSPDGFAVIGHDGKFGLIDKNGTFVLSPKYDSLEWMHGLARVKTGDVVQYVNLDGKIVWPN
ncbi:MAG: WG repeat-containing protein [Pyrinomonadaceae bacterium]